MVTPAVSAKIPALGHNRVRGRKMGAERKVRDYRRMRLLNTTTGKRHEVELFDPQSSDNEDILPDDPHFELKHDLKKALAPFSVLEKRILFRVLLQGQSVEEATKNSKKSRRWWAAWLTTSALPRLREALGSYIQNGKLVLR